MQDIPDPPQSTQDAPSEARALSYPDAPQRIIDLWMSRRRRMSFGPGEALPPPEVDLAALMATPVTESPPKPAGPMSLHGEKLHAIRAQMAGLSELAVLNAILISHLRKTGYPRHAPALFRRIWVEHGAALAAELNGRWLISSIITFADHGETEAQRRIGLSMNVLFSLMKLYEYERLHSGAAADLPFPIRRTYDKPLPLDMPGFALLGGGLDINLLAQLWTEARNEPVAGALACHLLQRLNADPRNLFRRLGLMRRTKRSQLAAKATAALAAELAPGVSTEDGLTLPETPEETPARGSEADL